MCTHLQTPMPTLSADRETIPEAANPLGLDDKRFGLLKGRILQSPWPAASRFALSESDQA